MSLALQYHRCAGRYFAARAVSSTRAGASLAGTLASNVAPLRLVEQTDPSLAGESWSRVEPMLSGICGSDLGLLTGRSSPYLGPLTSMPFVPGHEVVGRTLDDLPGLPQGSRVVIDPVLRCAARGVPPCPACIGGHTSRCDRITTGRLTAGLQIGFCADTGGGWSRRMVAHASQLHLVPDPMPDEIAVLVEPLACAVHAVRRVPIDPGASVLVIGAGTVGLLTLLALRELTAAGEVHVIAKHRHQADRARELGATQVIGADGAARALRRSTGALLVEPELGADYLLGGMDLVFECTGGATGLDTALRSLRAGGTVVASGMPSGGVDLTPLWYRELHLVGAYASAVGEQPCRGDFPAAIELAQSAPLHGYVDTKYPWNAGVRHSITLPRPAARAPSRSSSNQAAARSRREVGRPGFVLDVDERTPPLLIHQGEGFRLERLPLGSRVIYPPDSLPGIVDLEAAIRHALAHPHGSDPLPQLLRRGMRLTIVFDDLSLPLPPMRTPDVRQRVIEQVLEMAAAGVDDVELIAANSLHRRMTPAELKRTVGERVFRAFHPDHLRNHDAEDPDDLAHLGTTAHGEDVEINRRAAESDLIVYVNITLTAMNGGSKSVAVGLASYASLRHHHNVHTLRHSRSFNDPPNSAMHQSYDRMADLIGGHVPVFTIETTLNNNTFPAALRFLTRREWEWNITDQAGYLAVKRSNDLATAKLRHRIWQTTEAPYGVTGVHAGAPSEVHPHTLAAVHRQQLTEVQGQADVAIFGLPYICPYNVNSIMNPILVMSLGLGYFFNLYRGKPIVREGGVAIFYHPMPPEFHPVHHPSYIDFYELLAETTDPVILETKYEKQFATDPWYTHLYRTSYAYHGVHPFYMWYWGAHAMQHLGDVIFVGGDRTTTARLGFRAASSLADALELARDTVGPDPQISYLHAPPMVLADVR